MGTHSPKVEEGGEVQILYDKVTKGYDYYGPVANAAARVESLGFGGQTSEFPIFILVSYLFCGTFGCCRNEVHLHCILALITLLSVHSLRFNQTVISRDVYNKMSDRVKESCAISSIGEMELRGVSGSLFLYQMLPSQLEGRIFTGVYRRSGSTASTDTSSTFRLVEEASHDDDKTLDVYSLTPIELQRTLKRMQDRVFYLEHELNKERSMNAPRGGNLDSDILSNDSGSTGLSRSDSIKSDISSIGGMSEKE